MVSYQKKACVPMITSHTKQILGVGVDLVDVRRIEAMIARYGAHFLCRVFTEKERAYAQGHCAPEKFFGKRFAAKEAFSKAIGCGIGEVLSFQDIDISHTPKGQPFISLSPPHYERVTAFLGHPFTSFLSLTDEYPYAQAFVIVSQV
jgi:holo-[acyl-carrier protein] synthase